MKTNMSLREIEDLGFSLQDNICVFCSATMNKEMRICFGCGEYKGVINIVEAVGYYGKEVLPL
jgi:hypothetical protein